MARVRSTFYFFIFLNISFLAKKMEIINLNFENVFSAIYSKAELACFNVKSLLFYLQNCGRSKDLNIVNFKFIGEPINLYLPLYFLSPLTSYLLPQGSCSRSYFFGFSSCLVRIVFFFVAVKRRGKVTTKSLKLFLFYEPLS